MAEKMFAQQIRERGLGRRGPGDQRGHRQLACRRRAPTGGPTGCCAPHGYPTEHVAAQVDDDHLSADLVIALGRNHMRILTELGVEPDRVRMLRSFDPRSGAHAPDVEDPYYGDLDEFEDVFTVIDGRVAGPARLGRRATRAGTGRGLTPGLTRQACAFLLRPGWIAVALVVAAFAYLCFTVLAPWQLGKNTSTSRENNQIAASLTADPIPLTSVLPQQNSSAPDHQWSRVTATGHYLPDEQVLARLRVIEGDPAFEVLVPFVVDDGPTVLVDRGYVRPEQGSQVPPIASAADRHRDADRPTARLRGRPAGQGPRSSSNGVQQVYAIDTTQVSALFGVPLAGSYLQLVRGPARRARRDRHFHTSMPDRSCPTASSGSRSASSRRSGWATSSIPRSRSAARRTRPQRGARTLRQPVTVEDKLADRYGRATLSSANADRQSSRSALHRLGQHDRAPQVRDPRRRAVAERGPDLQFVAVLRRATQPHPESTGERRLDDTGVGAGMATRHRDARRATRHAVSRRPPARTRRPAARPPGHPGSLPHHPTVLRPNRIGCSAARGARSSRPGC